MAYNMTITVTSGINATEVSDEAAEAFQEAYDALSKLPVNRQCNLDFEDDKAARDFVRQGKAWAAEQEVVVDVKDDKGKVTGTRTTHLIFARKGTVKENPLRVSFRIYPAAAPKTEEVTDDTK